MGTYRDMEPSCYITSVHQCLSKMMVVTQKTALLNCIHSYTVWQSLRRLLCTLLCFSYQWTGTNDQKPCSVQAMSLGSAPLCSCLLCETHGVSGAPVPPRTLQLCKYIKYVGNWLVKRWPRMFCQMVWRDFWVLFWHFEILLLSEVLKLCLWAR